MNIPEFESDGSWSLTIRPNNPPVLAKIAGKKSGSFLIKNKVLHMKHTFMKVGKKVVAVAAGSVAVVGSASAAVPEEVTTALTGAQTDGVSIAATILGVIIAIVSFKYIRRAA